MTISVIANLIVDGLHPDGTLRNPELLFFASSPHKGLEEVMVAFTILRRAIPALRLEVADPGYLTRAHGVMPAGVVALGTLPHASVVRTMLKALCLLHPKIRFTEIFGLVIAEANAVGCPAALLHCGLGVNDERVRVRPQPVRRRRRCRHDCGTHRRMA